MRKNKSKVAALLIASLIITLLPVTPKDPSQETKPLAKAAHAASLSNPRIVPDSTMKAGQKVTWDCVWFGSYPQAEVITTAMSVGYTAIGRTCLQEGDLIVDDAAYAALQTATGWDANGDITLNGKKYRRIQKTDATNSKNGNSTYYNWTDSTTYHYFLYQPIKWRVLSTDGNRAFLLSDKALDDQKYNTVYTDTTWETSTIRSWLNGYDASANNQSIDYRNKNFLDSAFTLAEKSAIQNTLVANGNNLNHGTEGGNDTTDKLFLLSESEIYTDAAKSYGFASDGNTHDEVRRAKSSTYAKAMGTFFGTKAYVGNCFWWLRSPGNITSYTTLVNKYGYVGSQGNYVDCNFYGVRAALNLNLSASSDAVSSNLYSYAGTVCSDGTKEEVEAPTETQPNETPSTGLPGTQPSEIPSTELPGTQPDEIPDPDITDEIKQVVISKITAGKKKITVKWKRVEEADGYQIEISQKKNFRKGKKVTVKSGKKTKAVIKKLSSKKKYYVRVRAWINIEGKNTYGEWSQTKSKKLK